MNKISALKLLVSILLCQSAGVVGSFFTVASIPVWYATLNKPVFSPPSWVFAPVWLALYTLMGISLYLVWQNGVNEKSKKAIGVFAAQLFLNALWSVVFFGANSILGGFMVIAALWLAIVWTIVEFNKISKTAAYLLVPYIIWVSLASVLNFSIYLLNG